MRKSKLSAPVVKVNHAAAAAAALAEFANNNVKPFPEGAVTIAQIANESGLSRSIVEKRLRAAVKAGRMEFLGYYRSNGAGNVKAFRVVT